MNNDGSQPSNRVMPTLALNAEWAQDREQFTDLTANVFNFLANMRIQYRPIHVIPPMHPSNIAVCMFTICDLQNSIAVNFLVVSDNIWWLCNKHTTVSTDDKSKPFLPLIDVWIETLQMCNRLASVKT